MRAGGEEIRLGKTEEFLLYGFNNRDYTNVQFAIL